MKNKEIHSMKTEELQAKKLELKKELMKVESQIAVGTTPKSSLQRRTIRKTIARIETEIKNKEK
jgi:ribosomal protein L29